MAVATRRRGEDHQAKIGVFGQGKAKRQFGHARKLAIKEQSQPLRPCWIAGGRAGAKHLVDLFWPWVVAQPKMVIVGGLQKQHCNVVAVAHGVKWADQSFGHVMALIFSSMGPFGFFQVTLSPTSAPISARANGECALIRPKVGSASSSPVIS